MSENEKATFKNNSTVVVLGKAMIIDSLLRMNLLEKN